MADRERGDPAAGSSEPGEAPPGSLSPAERAKELVGRVIAERYRIEDVVAMGGMGAVYRGEHVHMRKRVALKLLHPETEGLPELVQRFERESIVGAHANHPNVASATDFGKLEDGSYYLVLELIDGITLHTLLRQGPIPIERAVDIARQMALGLAAIHELDIVHRDLKPRNVMVSEQPPDTVKLIDFGFAKLPVERFVGDKKPASLTTRNMLFGTVGFMAPEVTFGMHAVGPAADLYALGVILYEMLTGKHPYDPKETKALFRCHQMDPPPPFRERAPDRRIPAALERITMRLLEKAPDDRYPDAHAVVRALDAALSGEPEDDGEPAVIDMPPEPGEEEDASPAPTPISVVPRRRRGGQLGWVLVALLAGLGVAAYALPDLRARLLAAVGRRPPAAPATPSAPPTTPPSAAPSASATAALSAAPSATARPSEVDGLGADEWRQLLRAAGTVGDATKGGKAILALARIDPSRFEDRAVVIDAAAVAKVVELGDRATADAVFQLLSSQLGSAGIDVLYQTASVHGGSRGAARAGELLAKPEVRALASPALEVALALREALCDKKGDLMERVAAHGDDRALVLLQRMRPPDCTAGGCCLSHDPRYVKAVVEVGRRIRKP